MQNRSAVGRAIRRLSRSIEKEAALAVARQEFRSWLGVHQFANCEPPSGARSRTLAWSARQDWPGSIQWYILDESVIGAPEYRGMFYEIPFADLACMPRVTVPQIPRIARRYRAS
jgi:hypothetical protein